jgi:hypothetical protein
VIVAMDQGDSAKTIPALDVFPDGTSPVVGYSGVFGTVANGAIRLTTPSGWRYWASGAERAATVSVAGVA